MLYFYLCFQIKTSFLRLLIFKEHQSCVSCIISYTWVQKTTTKDNPTVLHKNKISKNKIMHHILKMGLLKCYSLCFKYLLVFFSRWMYPDAWPAVCCRKQGWWAMRLDQFPALKPRTMSENTHSSRGNCTLSENSSHAAVWSEHNNQLIQPKSGNFAATAPMSQDYQESSQSRSPLFLITENDALWIHFWFVPLPDSEPGIIPWRK